MTSTIFILVVGVYASIPDLNSKPAEFARFHAVADCRDAVKHVEARSTDTEIFVAVCVPDTVMVPVPNVVF